MVTNPATSEYPTVLEGGQVVGAIIYGLVDPAEPDRVRYVGKSLTPGTRLSVHIVEATRPGRSKKEQWIFDLLHADRSPRMVLLEHCTLRCRGRELWWYEYLRQSGQADLNTRPPLDTRDFPTDMPVQRSRIRVGSLCRVGRSVSPLARCARREDV